MVLYDFPTKKDKSLFLSLEEIKIFKFNCFLNFVGTHKTVHKSAKMVSFRIENKLQKKTQHINSNILDLKGSGFIPGRRSWDCYCTFVSQVRIYHIVKYVSLFKRSW